jgi:uncharacterized membrane protein
LSEIHKMEMFIARLMRSSVLVSGVLMALGVFFFLTSGNESCPVDMFDPQWILYGNPFLAPSHVIFLGFMVLIGTPLLRIMASIFVYAKSGDWMFTTITGLVLTVLVVSMLLGVG